MRDNNQVMWTNGSFAPVDPQLAALQKQSLIGLLVVLDVFLILVNLLFPLVDFFISRQFTRGDTHFAIQAVIFTINFIVFLSMYINRRYWERKQQQRLLAYTQPERYPAEKQPVPSEIIPQLAGVSVSARKNKAFTFIFVYIFILSGLLCYDFSLSILTCLLISFAVALVVGVCFLLFMFSKKSRASLPSVEIHEAAISAQAGNAGSMLNWQDARLFSTYRGPRTLFFFGKHIQYYELATAHTLLRWQWHHALAPNYVTRPALDQETYDRWQEQLLGYVVTRTGLPLHDLDAVELPPKERSRRQIFS